MIKNELKLNIIKLHENSENISSLEVFTRELYFYKDPELWDE